MFAEALARLPAQPEPTPKSEFVARQTRLTSQFRSDDVLILSSPPHAVHSNDVEYPYRTSSDLIYLTGWTEAETVAVLRCTEKGWITAQQASSLQNGAALCSVNQSRRIARCNSAKLQVTFGSDSDGHVRSNRNLTELWSQFDAQRRGALELSEFRSCISFLASRRSGQEELSSADLALVWSQLEREDEVAPAGQVSIPSLVVFVRSALMAQHSRHRGIKTHDRA